MAAISCKGKAAVESAVVASQVLCTLVIAAGIICGGVLLLDFESNSYTPIIAGLVFFVATLTLDGIFYYVDSRVSARAPSETELVLRECSSSKPECVSARAQVSFAFVTLPL